MNKNEPMERERERTKEIKARRTEKYHARKREILEEGRVKETTR